MPNPHQNARRLKDIEDVLYNTGLVIDIRYECRHTIVLFASSINGLNGLRLSYTLNQLKNIIIHIKGNKMLNMNDRVINKYGRTGAVVSINNSEYYRVLVKFDDDGTHEPFGDCGERLRGQIGPYDVRKIESVFKIDPIAIKGIGYRTNPYDTPPTQTIRIGKTPIPYTKFPGGEINVRIPTEVFDGYHSYMLYADLKTSDDIMALLMTVDALKQASPDPDIVLVINYFPYARQDRVCNEGEALSVRVMANLINSLKVSEVIITDPHSDVTPALLNNCTIENAMLHIVPKLLTEGTILVSPDAGSEKRLHSILKKCDEGQQYVCASKVRDVATGNIVKTEVNTSVDLVGKGVLIFDDIVDGARSFVELAKVLKSRGVERVELYITHGIFSNGLSELKKYVDKVYCYNILNDDIELGYVDKVHYIYGD